MPSKWLTWTPKSANGENVEPSKPAKGDTEESKSTTTPTFDGFAGDGMGAFPEFTIPAEGGQGVFPHCPKCAGFALYRPNNIRAYECLTCGQPDISEEMARRTQ